LKIEITSPELHVTIVQCTT